MVTPAAEFAQIFAIATGDHRHVELAALTATVTVTACDDVAVVASRRPRDVVTGKRRQVSRAFHGDLCEAKERSSCS